MLIHGNLINVEMISTNDDQQKKGIAALTSNRR